MRLSHAVLPWLLHAVAVVHGGAVADKASHRSNISTGGTDNHTRSTSSSSSSSSSTSTSRRLGPSAQLFDVAQTSSRTIASSSSSKSDDSGNRLESPHVAVSSSTSDDKTTTRKSSTTSKSTTDKGSKNSNSTLSSPGFDVLSNSTRTTSSSSRGLYSWRTAGTEANIPDAASIDCPWPPCTAACPIRNQACIASASAAASECKPEWDKYLAAASSWAKSKYGGTTLKTITGTLTKPVGVFTYASYSTDMEHSFQDAQGSWYHPVFGFGDSGVSITTTYIWNTVTSFPADQPLVWSSEVVQWSVTGYNISQVNWEFLSVPYGGYTAPTPYCSFTAVQSKSCGACTINGGKVDLYFWPPKITSTAVHANQTSHALTTTTGPEVAVANGLTMTSPSVYIWLSSVLAFDSCSQVGDTHTGTWLAMKPDEVLSLYDPATTGAVNFSMAHPMNWHALGDSVVAEAWYKNMGCGRHECKTLNGSGLEPLLSIPLNIRSLDPAWASCEPGTGGLRDPPIALTPVQVVAVATLPPSPLSTPATPASSPDTPAQQTTTSTPGLVGSPNLPSSSIQNTPPSSAGNQGSGPQQSFGPQSSSSQQADTPLNTQEIDQQDPSPSSGMFYNPLNSASAAQQGSQNGDGNAQTAYVYDPATTITTTTTSTVQTEANMQSNIADYIANVLGIPRPSQSAAEQPQATHNSTSTTLTETSSSRKSQGKGTHYSSATSNTDSKGGFGGGASSTTGTTQSSSTPTQPTAQNHPTDSSSYSSSTTGKGSGSGNVNAAPIAPAINAALSLTPRRVLIAAMALMISACI